MDFTYPVPTDLCGLSDCSCLTLCPASQRVPPGFCSLSYFLTFSQATSSPWNPLPSPLHRLTPDYPQAPAYGPLPPESLPGLLHLHPSRLCYMPLLCSLCALYVHHQKTYPFIFCLFSCPCLLSGTLSVRAESWLSNLSFNPCTVPDKCLNE